MLIIEKVKIKNLVGELAKKMPVFLPVRKPNRIVAQSVAGGKINGAIESVFEKFNAETEPDLDYLPTLRSAKEFFLPAKEEIFISQKSRTNTLHAPKPFALFGLNARDIEALDQLDEIMSKPNEDFFYLQKRKMATIIGVINEPIKIPPPADLVLLKINSDQYQVISYTQKGINLNKNRLFKKEKELIFSAGKQTAQNEIMPKLRELLLNPELLADAVKWSWKQDLAIWDELASLCLGCGICTYVCPLCYCFSMEDSVSLDGKCRRCREWDACTLPRFAQISGGYNFHKTIRERYYNWFFHKFVRSYKEYGKSQCVACGRCQKYCPAKIDIEKYLLRIVENYKKAMSL